MVESLESQVARLASVIINEFPGEPSTSDGAVDVAIRLLRAKPSAPEFTIKAKDRFAIQIMAHYRRICIHHGLRDQAHEVLLAIRDMTAWRAVHFDEVHFPDHQHVSVEDNEVY